jgi:hypothetical protein
MAFLIEAMASSFGRMPARAKNAVCMTVLIWPVMPLSLATL